MVRLKGKVLLLASAGTLLLLAGCGTNYTGGSPSPTGIAGTPGTAIAVTRVPGRGSPTASPIATATGPKGTVTLQLTTVPQHSSDAIVLTLNNQTGQTILFSDHLTDCTVVLLQMQSANIGTWQAVAPCRLMTPTRLLSLASGKALTIKLVPPGGRWVSGLYRSLMSYILPGANQQLQTVFSPNFQVGT